LKKLDWITTNIHRIDAVLEKWCGHLGCGKSHIKAIEFAIEKNWDSVLIVEDDVAFVDVTNLNNIKNIKWGVMMLGYGHHHLQDCEYSFLKKVKSATCAHAYIVKKDYYQTILDNFKEAVKNMTRELEAHLETNTTKLHYCSAIDQYWSSLQEKDMFYTFDPVIAIQSELGSDNNCEEDYQSNRIEELASTS
jgi:GR25 family glycosyltransferase involved in LPS biosynthesis